MSETEIKERLARIETMLENLIIRMDKDEKHRADCYDRFNALEEHIDIQKGQDKEREKIFGKMVSVITIINIITLLSLKIIFHI